MSEGCGGGARENRDHGGAESTLGVCGKGALRLVSAVPGADVGGFFVSDAFRMFCLKGNKICI